MLSVSDLSAAMAVCKFDENANVGTARCTPSFLRDWLDGTGQRARGPRRTGEIDSGRGQSSGRVGSALGHLRDRAKLDLGAAYRGNAGRDRTGARVRLVASGLCIAPNS